MNKQKCLSLYAPLLLITNIHYCFCSLWTTASRMPCAQPEKKNLTYDNNMQQNRIRKEPW